MYHGKKTMYQINQMIKVLEPTKWNVDNYNYKRILITKCTNRIQYLLNFDNNNCQPKPYQYNTKYGR